MATTIRVYVDGGSTAAATGLMAADRSFSVPVPNVPDGTHTFDVTAQEDGKAESAKTRVLNQLGNDQVVVSRAGLSASLTGIATVVANLTVPKPLAAQLTATGTVAADLSVGGASHPLAAAITGSAVTTANLTAPGAGTTVGNDHYAIGTLSGPAGHNSPPNAPYAAVWARRTGTTGYAAYFWDDGEGGYFLTLARMNNTPVIGTTQNATFTGGRTSIKIEAIGIGTGNIKVYDATSAAGPWTLRLTKTDSTYATGIPSETHGGTGTVTNYAEGNAP